MKNFMNFLMIAILTVMVMVSCDNGPTGPNDKPDETLGKLILVPLGNDELAKVFVGEDGREYLPREAAVNNLKKMGRLAIRMEDVNKRSLYKIASAMIDFGEVINTRQLQFVVMNVGNQDIFGIFFSANDLVIFPGAIGMLQASEQGTEVTALPIINIVKEHVTPVNLTGSLLDMEVGSFTDTLSLLYSYTLGNDTVNVSDNYDVAGTKMGAVISILVSGINLEVYSSQIRQYAAPGYTQEFISLPTLTSSMLDTVLIINDGNAPLRISIESASHEDTVLNSMVYANDTLDISGVWRGLDFVSDSSGELLLLGSTRNQPYTYSLLNDLYTQGASGIELSEVP